jgi:hypothetical protein
LDSNDEGPNDGYTTDKSTKAARKKANASKSHGSYTSVVTQKDTLERDEYTKNVRAEKFTCKACNKIVKLSNHMERIRDCSLGQTKKQMPAHNVQADRLNCSEEARG